MARQTKEKKATGFKFLEKIEGSNDGSNEKFSETITTKVTPSFKAKFDKAQEVAGKNGFKVKPPAELLRDFLIAYVAEVEEATGVLLDQIEMELGDKPKRRASEAPSAS